jgi:hypothetical protein
MANRKSRKCDVLGRDWEPAKVVFEGGATGVIPVSFEIRRAIKPVNMLMATAQTMVWRKPEAGSRINPEIRVPPTAPRVLTQYNWLTRILSSAAFLATQESQCQQEGLRAPHGRIRCYVEPPHPG